jgi:hypothetical protein
MRNAMPAKTRLRRVAIFVLLIAIHFYGAPGQVRANQDVAASPGDGTVIKDVIEKGKPFCFLMNTRFEEFSHKRVELYMKRALAYGMFPGFFSHNASQGHYFSRPELYNRDRPLFKKYVPLCKLVAEAGWEPITLARSSDQKVYLERFGDRYLTVFNDSGDRQTASIRTEMPMGSSSRELLSSRPIIWDDGKTTLTLDPEGVAVIDLGTR